jgi:hypothetical protein
MNSTLILYHPIYLVQQGYDNGQGGGAEASNTEGCSA